MNGTLPVSVSLGAQVLKRYGVGDTIEERFANILKPSSLSEGCWMCGTDDEMFRAAVGGLLLSYDDGSPERERIEQTMQALNRVSVLINAAALGMSVNLPEPDPDFKAVGLVRLWNAREKK